MHEGLRSQSSTLLRTIRQEGLAVGVETVRRYLMYRLYHRFQINGGLLLREVQGSKMYLDVNDKGISRDLAIRGVREPIHTEIIKRELGEGMVVVDIGASIGYYALIEAREVGEEGRVYAIEPSPGSFTLLKRNIEVNGFSDVVQAYNMAISDRSGKARLYLSERWNLHTMLHPEEFLSAYHEVDRYVEVSTTTLDDFLADKKPVDLMRMDVEGCEIEVFDGMTKTLRNGNSPRKILFETHPSRYTANHRLKPRLEMLLSCGYEPRAIWVDDGVRGQGPIESSGEPEVATGAGESGASYNASKVSWDDFTRVNCPPNAQDAIHHYILLQKQG